MGLDSVELVLRIEEEFSIALPDDALSETRTVGDLYGLILRKLETVPDCLTSKAFYQTRNALVDVLGVSRRSIRPSTDLEPLFPLDRRKQLWGEIVRDNVLQFPRLKYSITWRGRFIGLGFAVATAAVLAGWIEAFHHFGAGGGFGSFSVAVIGWIILFGATERLLWHRMQFLRSEIPVANAGELARVVLGMNASFFEPKEPDQQRFSKDLVWIRLVQIFCEQLGLAPEEIVPGATIAEDLRVD